MSIIVYIALGLFAVSALVFWAYSVVDLARSAQFSDGSKVAWLIVILLVPVGGPIAYLSAKKYIKRFSAPEPTRLGRLIAKEKK